MGLCEVCNYVEAKYTCPKCEVKTCCLRCLNIHKRELECTGIRDKTKFIAIKAMTGSDFMSDYAFLEDCTRYVAERKRDRRKVHTRFNKSLPTHLFKLRAAAHQRQIQLRFLLAIFSAHIENTTFYDWKEQCIYWRIVWHFRNAGNLRLADERCNEQTRLSCLLTKYVVGCRDGDANPLLGLSDVVRNNLRMGYQTKEFDGLRVLLKAEGVKGCRNRFYELDVDRTLAENLAGKTIVEFPTIHVVYTDVAADMNIIDSGEFERAKTTIVCVCTQKAQMIVLCVVFLCVDNIDLETITAVST